MESMRREIASRRVKNNVVVGGAAHRLVDIVVFGHLPLAESAQHCPRAHRWRGCSAHRIKGKKDGSLAKSYDVRGEGFATWPARSLLNYENWIFLAQIFNHFFNILFGKLKMFSPEFVQFNQEFIQLPLRWIIFHFIDLFFSQFATVKLTFAHGTWNQ